MSSIFKNVILNTIKALPSVVPDIESALNLPDEDVSKAQKVESVLTDIEALVALIRGAFGNGSNK